jgi:hypothetical protein
VKNFKYIKRNKFVYTFTQKKYPLLPPLSLNPSNGLYRLLLSSLITLPLFLVIWSHCKAQIDTFKDECAPGVELIALTTGTENLKFALANTANFPLSCLRMLLKILPLQTRSEKIIVCWKVFR